MHVDSSNFWKEEIWDVAGVSSGEAMIENFWETGIKLMRNDYYLSHAFFIKCFLTVESTSMFWAFFKIWTCCQLKKIRNSIIAIPVT